tara:strand:- start:1954 stop:2682 length:729 start_codon:yes stop_codon:yes gene_type:complete
MNVAIDIGNTRIKLGIFDQKKLILKKEVEPAEFESLFYKIIEDYSLEQAIVAATGKSKNVVTLLKKSGLSVNVLDHNTPVPFKNMYQTPETLGLDRIALMAAATNKYAGKNTLVIDAGTCVTYDFKNDKDEYLGGAISPGLQMRYRALNAFTAGLPLLKPEDDFPAMGKDTSGSIHAGVSGGFVLEIEGVIGWYEGNYSDLTVILTGGDGLFLSKTLKNGIFANSNFLLEGLNYLIVFNTNQ